VVDSSNLVDPPGLVQSVVAVPEDDVSVVSVTLSVNIKALSSIVLDVSSGSVVPSDSILVEALVWSDVSSDSDSEVLSELVTNAVSSSVPGSDSLSSGIEGPPLLHVGWVVVLDSQSELVSANVLVPEEGSISLHS